MAQRQLARVFLGEGFEEKGSEIGDVRAHVHEAVIFRTTEGEVGGEEPVVAFRGEDGDNVGGEGRGEEEREELCGEAHARVVEERVEGVKAFFGFWPLCQLEARQEKSQVLKG